MNQLDPVNVAVLAFAALIGSTELAQIIGPYAVICIMASIGAAWSLGGTKGLGWFQSLGYFFLIVLTAIITTFYITQGILHFFGSYFPKDSSGHPATWLMGGVALFIGGMGTNWKGLFVIAANKLKSKVKALFGGNTP